MRRMATILVLTAVSITAAPVMTNAMIEAMVSDGVPLASIVRAIKTATKIELYEGRHDYNRLINAGASASDADQIIKAIHYREYEGFDRSPDRPVVAAVKPTPAPAPVAATAPVPAPVAPVPTAATSFTAPVPVPAPVATVAPVPVPAAHPTAPESASSLSRPLSPSQAGTRPSSLPGPSMSARNPDMLTDSEVTDAILKSRLNERHRIGLILNDQQTAWGSVLASALASATCDTCPVQGAVSGYTIFVYTPEQWIEQMAVNARREMLPFTIDSVTPDMRMKMLHVVAMPSTPEYLNGNGFALSSSVHRIVITDTSRNDIVQPVHLENGSITINSALRSAEFSTGSAAFMMSDVERLRASDAKREFFITVTGSNQIKFFKVKERFFNTLFN